MVDISSACGIVQCEYDGAAYEEVYQSLKRQANEAVNVELSRPQRFDDENAYPTGSDIVAEDAGAEQKRQHTAAPAEKKSAPVPRFRRKRNEKKKPVYCE
jgi:hypothetical protein